MSRNLLLIVLTALQGPIFCLRLPLYRSLDESGVMDVNQQHYIVLLEHVGQTHDAWGIILSTKLQS